MERGDMERQDTARDDMAAEQRPADDLVIEREIDLGLSGDELWALVGTAEGWRRWLVDEGELAIRDGEHARVVDGGVERDVHIDAVDHGRSVTFRWWEHDDPGSASEVSISIVRRPDGSQGIAVVERVAAARLVGTASACATGADAVRFARFARFAWEVRACLAWASTRATATV